MNHEQIATHVNNLTESLKDLSADKEFEELLTIIHKPGWTTVAEAALVIGILESMNAHVQHLNTVKKSLLAGARAVATK
jgi:gamma-glutamylcysteine synthetase